MNVEQLSLFGESSTQEHFHSELWGLLTFFPHKDDNRCRKCLLCRSEKDCMNAPCDASERVDKQTGYFSIHEIPRT